MERHLPHGFLSYVQRESEFDHVLVQTVIVCGGQLTSIRHSFNTIQAEPGDCVELPNYAGVLAVHQAGEVD